MVCKHKHMGANPFTCVYWMNRLINFPASTSTYDLGLRVWALLLVATRKTMRKFISLPCPDSWADTRSWNRKEHLVKNNHLRPESMRWSILPSFQFHPFRLTKAIHSHVETHFHSIGFRKFPLNGFYRTLPMESPFSSRSLVSIQFALLCLHFYRINICILGIAWTKANRVQGTASHGSVRSPDEERCSKWW